MKGKGAVDSWTRSKIRSKRGSFLGRVEGGKNDELKELKSKKYLTKV